VSAGRVALRRTQAHGRACRFAVERGGGAWRAQRCGRQPPRLRAVEQKARRLRNVTNGATPYAPATAASTHREHAFEGQLEPGSWFFIGTIHLRALDVSGPTSQIQPRVARLDGHRRTLPRQSARESAPRSFISTLGPVTPESPLRCRPTGNVANRFGILRDR